MEYRSLNIDQLIGEDRILRFSFSSEEPYMRSYGLEVLGHEEGCIDFSRLNNSAPLLVDHNTGQLVGVVLRAGLENKRTFCEVKFSRNAFAQEIVNDINDKIRRNVSVGYQIDEMIEEQRNGKTVYVAKKWTPLEVSIVAIPADQTVGILRKQEVAPEALQEEIKQENKKEVKKMDVNIVEIENAAAKRERERVSAVNSIVEKYPVMKEDAQRAIENGMDLGDFRALVLEKAFNAKPVQPTETADLGMSKKEVKEYNLFRAIKAATLGDWSMAEFEREVSNEVAKRTKRESSNQHSFYLPEDLLKRDMSTTSTEGGYNVATQVRSIIDELSDALFVEKLGATFFRSLTGNVAIPRANAVCAGYWVAENVAPTESSPTFTQIAMSPNRVATYVEISRQLLLQSSNDVQSYVNMLLGRALAEALNVAAINGTAATTDAQPTGILNDTNVNSIIAGDSTAGAALAWGDIVNMETEVSVDNGLQGRLAYLTNAKVRGKLKQTLSSSAAGANFIWNNSPVVGVGEVNGYPAYVSNLVPSDLADASSTALLNNSAMVFGNWADLLIGMWGGLELMVNPYSLDTQNQIRICANMLADIAIAHPESFCIVKDVITS